MAGIMVTLYNTHKISHASDEITVFCFYKIACILSNMLCDNVAC